MGQIPTKCSTKLLSHLVTFHSKQQLLPLFHSLAPHCFSGLS
ncbi:hypothetical protein HanXRQr2_Chr04g0182811 [Helianthus annuus]|uniref:Uncharacterized protein n=1 Tax=Helianthus annuus TaxID=4232 RepID=A0A9K3JB26_HELAN|nr:hypothetical protein HanXRQr2_Chr04g0182811 [Helianthus annuus]KAJ0932672.1 hypothetical protein HanPSC8_Chr04g0176311 [Helianthus annuus]